MYIPLWPHGFLPQGPGATPVEVPAMPRAVPYPLREQVIHLHERGHSLTAIAQRLSLPYPTVRDLWRRYREQGVAGLDVHYERCGRRGVRAPAALYAAALALKRAHPRWGGPVIRLELAQQFPAAPLPGVRTLQTWFAQAGLQPTRAVLPPTQRQRARQVHEVWELDAKERLRLQDGTGTSLLTATDEASGTLLGLVPFPPVSLGTGPGPSRAGHPPRALHPVGLAATAARG